VDDFAILKVIGRGSFGKIFLVRGKQDNKVCAGKRRGGGGRGGGRGWREERGRREGGDGGGGGGGKGKGFCYFGSCRLLGKNLGRGKRGKEEGWKLSTCLFPFLALRDENAPKVYARGTWRD
jgi:hypothetical protein